MFCLLLLMGFASVQTDVDVAVAVVTVKKTITPVLPNSDKRRYSEPTPLPLGESKAAPPVSTEEQLLRENENLRGTIQHLERALETLKREYLELKNGNAPKASKSSPVASLFDGMEFSYGGKAEIPSYEVWVFTGEDAYGVGWCGNCGPYWEKVKKGLPDLVVKKSTAVAPSGGQTQGENQYPAVRIKGPNGEWHTPAVESIINGQKVYVYTRPETVEDLLEYAERVFLREPPKGVAGGLLGSFKGKEKIKAGLARWQEWVRPGSKVYLSLSRSGDQEVSLLRRGSKGRAEQWLGKSGRLSFRVEGGFINSDLPREFSIPYNVKGNDFGVGLDMVYFEGAAKKLGFDDADEGAMMAGPAGFVDPMTLWTIFSVIRGAISLFNPTCDLLLGGDIELVAWMDDSEQLTIELTQGVSVRFVMLFKFMLGLKRIVVSEENIHFDLTGSSWIRKLDMPVEG